MLSHMTVRSVSVIAKNPFTHPGSADRAHSGTISAGCLEPNPAKCKQRRESPCENYITVGSSAPILAIEMPSHPLCRSRHPFNAAPPLMRRPELNSSHRVTRARLCVCGSNNEPPAAFEDILVFHSLCDDVGRVSRETGMFG